MGSSVVGRAAGMFAVANVDDLVLLAVFFGRPGSAWRVVAGQYLGFLGILAVTFANGGDNIGVYVPVFAVAGTGDMTTYLAVFLIGVAVWCAASWFLATRPPVARTLARWGHLVLPVVLTAIGLMILIEGL